MRRSGKTNKQIADEVKHFCHSEYHNAKSRKEYSNKPEFYAYFADYDWVVFCWLFGKMIDLPKGFPMYCKDLKQIFDEKQNLRLQLNGHKIRAHRPSLTVLDIDLKIILITQNKTRQNHTMPSKMLAGTRNFMNF